MPSRANPSARALRSKDPVELRHADFADRVLLVHHDHEVVLPAHHLVRTGDDHDANRRPPLYALKRQVVIEGWRMSNANIGHIERETAGRSGSRLQVEI